MTPFLEISLHPLFETFATIKKIKDNGYNTASEKIDPTILILKIENIKFENKI